MDYSFQLMGLGSNPKFLLNGDLPGFLWCVYNHLPLCQYRLFF